MVHCKRKYHIDSKYYHMRYYATMNFDKDITKQDMIVSELRGSIARNELEAGARLPIRSELEIRFGASRMTVQKALDRLIREGFVQPRGRLGTMVVPHPPCLCRYGVVFYDSPHDPTWGGFHAAILRVGHELNEAPGREIVFYFGVNREVTGDYERLSADLWAERLAGVLFTTGPWFLLGTPIVQQRRIPAMAVMRHVNRKDKLAHFDSLQLDRDSLLREGLRTLVEKGSRRPAFLIAAASYPVYVEAIRAALAERSMPYDPALIQGVPLEQGKLAAHVALLWMRLPIGERPDGLFICDDNLVEPACGGLLQSGVRPGIDLPVAVDANFPARVGSPTLLDRVGFDMRSLLHQFIENTDARRAGRPATEAILLPAVLEENSNPARGVRGEDDADGSQVVIAAPVGAG